MLALLLGSRGLFVAPERFVTLEEVGERMSLSLAYANQPSEKSTKKSRELWF